MTIEELTKKITEAVEEYIADEEAYSDNVQLQINTLTWDVEIADPENDLPDCDYYPVMDLISMSVDNPGTWIADADAIESVAEEYSL